MKDSTLQLYLTSIMVPRSCITGYKTFEPWKRVKSIQESRNHTGKLTLGGGV